MSASKNTPPSNVTSDEVDAAVNMASLSSSTLTMSGVARQFLRGFEDNIETKNFASASKSANNPPESTVVVEATSIVADEEVQVLEDGPKKLNVRCSRIFIGARPMQSSAQIGQLKVEEQEKHSTA